MKGSTVKHGISLRTLIRKSADLPGPCLLVCSNLFLCYLLYGYLLLEISFFFRLLKASGVNYIVHTDRWGYERCCIWRAAGVPPKTYCKEKVSSKFTM